jgi:hypothetical protein
LQPFFIKSGERFVNVNAIVSFDILPTGFGDLILVNSQRIAVPPKEARWLADYLSRFSEEFRPVQEFPRGYYPIPGKVMPGRAR